METHFHVFWLKLGIRSNSSKLMSASIYGPFSLDSVSEVRFWELSHIFGPKKMNWPCWFYEFLKEKISVIFGYWFLCDYSLVIPTNGHKWSQMLENCQEPNTYIVCTCKQNNKLIALTEHERLSTETGPLNMEIKTKFQRNSFHMFDVDSDGVHTSRRFASRAASSNLKLLC